ncbi:MAG: hypothetical protein Ct9H90mP16_18130 [Candidatus Poseidoniales archaeon]|nr:MAG: hypothetical protein Ct9H90mP16_18130 [Candidatus Poseidoniales archaeon]
MQSGDATGNPPYLGRTHHCGHACFNEEETLGACIVVYPHVEPCFVLMMVFRLILSNRKKIGRRFTIIVPIGYGGALKTIFGTGPKSAPASIGHLRQ